jgi:hypothetical protein
LEFRLQAEKPAEAGTPNYQEVPGQSTTNIILHRSVYMMTPVQFQISELIQELFSPYGRILEPQEHEVPEVSESEVFDFYVIFKESS